MGRARRMWRRIAAMVLLCACACGAQLPRVAVLELAAVRMSPADVAAVFASLHQELYDRGAYDLIERGRIEAAFSEQALSLSGAVQDSKAVEVGKLLGAQFLLMGSLSAIRDGTILSLRLVDVETGRIVRVATHKQRGKLKLLLRKGIGEAVDRLVGDDGPMIELDFSFVASRGGKTFAVQSGDTLRTGDRVHIVVRSSQRCFVYVVNQDARGNVYALFPNPSQPFRALGAGEELHIPARGKTFELDDVTGEEFVHLTASLTPLADVDSLLITKTHQQARDERLLSAMQTRGFATIVEGGEASVPLENGVTYEGNLDRLMGSGTFHHTVSFTHE